MEEKIVWTVKVISRNFVSDFFARMKNVIGGRLKTYEKMIDKSLSLASEDFYLKYPEAKQVRMEISEFTGGAMAIIIHGVIIHGSE